MVWHVSAIAPPSRWAIVDEMAMDQSDARNGLVLTRFPDPAVVAQRWELDFDIMPKGWEAAALEHYSAHAANKSFAWVPPYALPPGTTSEQVAYRGGLEVRPDTNTTLHGRVTFERAFAHD